MSSAPLKVVVFLGTVKENRLGIRVAKFMMNQLTKSGHEAILFDPIEKKLPLMEKAAFFYRPEDDKPAVLTEMEVQIRDADAFVVVSGEYNHSIPPALANMMDYFGGSCYAYKPSAIVCYSPGIYGGMRAAMQLRAFLGELGCLSVSNIFGIPRAHEAIGEDGSPVDSHMESGAEKLLKDLDWHAHAMRNHRNTVGKPK